MWSIRQTGPDSWEVLRDGEVVSIGGAMSVATYPLALAFIATQLGVPATLDAENDMPTGDGLLPEVWTDAGGIAFSEPTGDGRDFSACVWTSRDPEVSTLPLMFQDETDMGHFGAELAGFIETITVDGGTVHARGRFYDTDTGREARNLLLGGRRFGVSVDPGAVEVEWVCLEEDDEGWCVDERIDFLAYEVIGVTMTPFPGFAAAAIQLEGAETQAVAAAADGDLAMADPVTDHEFVDDNDTGFCSFPIETDGDTVQRICGVTADMHEDAAAADTEEMAVAASGLTIPTAPPSVWFHMPEPEPGMNADLSVYGMPANELLVEQPDGGMAVPLTITEDGRVFGHIARWGSCHVGFPGQCVTPPESQAAYAHFHVGEVVCDDGERVAAGTLTVGCEHAALRGLTASEARDHYAHAGMGFANVRVTNGQYGAWACGALRPDVTAEQVRILRSLSLSGDWRRLGAGLELIGALAVNVPGFPIARESVTASGLTLVASATTRGAVSSGEPQALVASGVVHRCADCQRRAAEAARNRPSATGPAVPAEVVARLDRIDAALAVITRRTAPLVGQAREHFASRISGT